MMTTHSAQSFAVWLLKEHPALFYAAAKHANPSLGAFSDILSNVGGAFSTAVKGVGTWISNPANLKSLVDLGGTYFATVAAKDAANAQIAALKTQAERAENGQPAAPISTAVDANGQPVPVYTGASFIPGLGAPMALPSGQMGYTLSPTALATLQPSFIQKYGLWLAGGGILLVGAVVLLR